MGGGVVSGLIDKAALSVVAAAARDDARPQLAGVLVGRGKAVCADGFRLMAVDLPGPPDPDRPPVLVPAKALESAVKGLGLKGDECASVTADGAGGAVVAAVRGGGGQMTVPLIDATFPDWACVVPNEEPVARFAVSARLLEGLCKAMVAFGADNDCVEVVVRGHDRAVTLRGVRRRDRREALAVLMPMTLAGFEDEGGGQ